MMHVWIIIEQCGFNYYSKVLYYFAQMITLIQKDMICWSHSRQNLIHIFQSRNQWVKNLEVESRSRHKHDDDEDEK
jgi:lipopolysaccharide biosynthesis regulator YciM